MERQAITAVCFDAGGTLLYCDPPPPQIYAEHLSRFGRPVETEQVTVAFRQAWAEMQRRIAPGVDRYGSMVGGEHAWWGAFVRSVIDRLRHDAPWEPLLDELYSAFASASVWRTYPDALPAIAALRERGARLAVVSNWDRRLLRILDDLELTSCFATVTVSSLEGVEKPDPEIFRHALLSLEVSAGEAIHVGDSPEEDYHGAASAGLTPLLIDRRGAYRGGPYRTIASLEELLDIVG